MFADVIIVVTLIVVLSYAGKEFKDHGSDLNTVSFMATWTDSIGFSVYAFEGIGLILPVQEITKKPEAYKTVVLYVFATCLILMVGFGLLTVSAWGDKLTTPLITDMLPDNTFCYIIKIFFCVNLIFSHPLQLYPAHIIIENMIYNGWPKSKKRQMSKNFTRTLLVGLTTIFTMSLGEKVDKFLSILGALTCTPIAFTFPALFHLKACAKTPGQKAFDLIIIAFSLVIQVYCTALGVINW